MDRKWWMFLAGVGTMLATLAVVGLVVVYSGAVNIAATTVEPAPLRWMLHTTMEHSIEAHAEDIPEPPPFDSALLVTGFHEYEAMCIVCHGAPGVEPTAIGQGLRPDPPELSEEAGEWSSRELFWIVKHGIMMSGMPAFGPTHSEESLWGIVAAVERLPELSPEEYRAYVRAAEAAGHTHGEGGGDHSHGASAGAPVADSAANVHVHEDGETHVH